MIYIYRTLWLLLYMPILALEILIFTIGIPILIVSLIVCYIVTGDVDSIPDVCVPGKLSVMLDEWYKDFEK